MAMLCAAPQMIVSCVILHLYNGLKSGQVVAVSLQDSDSGSEKKRALGSLLAKGLLARSWEA